ncbi:AraC family transcriptional regulator [Weeksellaceae bacterium KMM 9724]|uniref:AraC family transcriptional regulator n=1 Tax=Profundicola chukchiensis TaxID=2961959 RepID=UPI00243DDB4E|nr:helix-turn-helix transcriptional regulator [Profundicola chukchiensis]MDG4950612.1 AraC family transcriptional regulator [Profundicola chukchiensis]
MENLKIYQKVNQHESSLSFGISKMEDIYEKRNGKVDEPHRHDYYTVLIIIKAKGKHKIDFNTYDLAASQIYFVAPGQVHQVIESEKSFGYSMVFSNQFLIESSISLSFIERLKLFDNYGQSPPLEPNPSQFENILGFAEEIHKLYHSDAHMRYLSIGAYLKLLLIECNNICSINPEDSELDSPANKIIRDFKTTVDLNYKKEHSTSFYAQELFITPDHLNRTIKEKMGKTAKEYIMARITTEAKRLLYFTDLTNKEIAYELGFNDPGNFSAFFKKNTQISPSSFKSKEKIK